MDTNSHLLAAIKILNNRIVCSLIKDEKEEAVITDDIQFTNEDVFYTKLFGAFEHLLTKTELTPDKLCYTDNHMKIETPFLFPEVVCKILEEKYNIPVLYESIQNFFALGEAYHGYLPFINKQLKENGVTKEYKNLLAVKLGNEIKAGLVANGVLYKGDNNCELKLGNLRDKFNHEEFAGKNIGLHPLKEAFTELTGTFEEDIPDAQGIYEYAVGNISGYKYAAEETLKRMASSIGEVLVNAITLLDCVVVIGGDFSEAAGFMLPYITKVMNEKLVSHNGIKMNRLVQHVYNGESEIDMNKLYQENLSTVSVMGKDYSVSPKGKTILGITKLGYPEAVNLGMYKLAFNL